MLLKRARALMAEDDAKQPAMKHLDAALHAAEKRAAILEDWYRRTYPSEDSGSPNPGIEAKRGGKLGLKRRERCQANWCSSHNLKESVGPASITN